MVFSWAVIGLLLLLISVIEGGAWLLFHRKVEGLNFPRECDASFFGFFTLTRMRLMTILHAAFLFAVCTVSLLFLW